MSLYHLSLKTVARADGKNALASAAYRSGEKLTDELTDTTFDYTRKQNVNGGFIVTPEGAPEWAKDRSKLWNQVEKSETNKDGSLKKNARLAYEIELSLQTELSPEENMKMTKRFFEENFTSRGFIVDVNFHNLKEQYDENDNPHAHCMITTRELKEDGFGKKIDRDTIKKREFLENTIRPSWEQHINETFEKNNVSERVTCKSFKKLGITDKRPEKYLGPKVLGLAAKEIETDRMKEFRQDKLYNQIVKKEKEVKMKMEKLKQEKEVKSAPNPEQISQIPADKTKVDKVIPKSINQEKFKSEPSEVPSDRSAAAKKIVELSSQRTIINQQIYQFQQRVQAINEKLKRGDNIGSNIEAKERLIANLHKPQAGESRAERRQRYVEELQQEKRFKEELAELKQFQMEFEKERPSLIDEKNALGRDIDKLRSQSKEILNQEEEVKRAVVPSKSKKRTKSRNKGFQKD